MTALAQDDKSRRTRAECIEDIWLTAALLLALLTLVLTAHPMSAAVTFVAAGPVPIVVYRGIVSANRRRMEITDLDTRPAREFVQVMAERFRSQGYRVRRAPRRQAQAYDLLLRQHGRRIAVQVTPSHAPVEQEAVRRLVPAMTKCRADAGWIVTNSTFDPQAEAVAREAQVVLWDRFRLTGFLLETAGKQRYGYSEDVAE